MLRDLRFRLRALVRRGRAEDDLDDELRFHLDRAVEQHVARGVSPREARRRARLAFGPIDTVKDDCRQSWGIRQLDVLGRDVACALRLMRKHPALSAIAAASLAVGIGLNTALFALVDATLFRRLPVDRPEQLVDVYASETGGFAWHGSSYPDYVDLRDGARALTGLVGYAPAMAAVGSGDETRARSVELVTGDYFQVLGVPAALGRALSPDDDRPGAAPVVVISAAFWSAAFDADSAAVGRTLRIGGRPYTIVGVAPAPFGGMNAPVLTPALWMPVAWVDDVQPVVLESSRRSPGATRLERRGVRWMFVKGRLREGETAAGAAADLNGVMRALEEAYPGSNEGFRVTVVPTGDVATHPMIEGRLRAGAVSLLALMGLVLLIVCANVAGLLLERASGRRREMGLRLALGATRGRLVRQLLAESTVLSLLGAAGGVALAWGLLEGLGAIRAPLLVPVALDLALNGRILGLSVAVALGAGVAAGLMPAWTGTRSSVLGALAGGAPTWSVGGRRWSPRHALVTIQIAVSLVLLVMAGLLARNLVVASRADHAAGAAADRSGRGLLAGADAARQRRGAVAAGAAALGDARDGGHGGGVAGRAGPLRRDRAGGRAADPRDRHPHGAGRDAPRRAGARRPARRVLGGRRRRGRRGAGVRGGPDHRRRAVRCRRGGSVGLGGCGGHAGRGRRAGSRPSCAAGRAGGPGGGAARGMRPPGCVWSSRGARGGLALSVVCGPAEVLAADSLSVRTDERPFLRADCARPRSTAGCGRRLSTEQDPCRQPETPPPRAMVARTTTGLGRALAPRWHVSCPLRGGGAPSFRGFQSVLNDTQLAPPSAARDRQPAVAGEESTCTPSRAVVLQRGPVRSGG